MSLISFSTCSRREPFGSVTIFGGYMPLLAPNQQCQSTLSNRKAMTPTMAWPNPFSSPSGLWKDWLLLHATWFSLHCKPFKYIFISQNAPAKLRTQNVPCKFMWNVQMSEISNDIPGHGTHMLSQVSACWAHVTTNTHCIPFHNNIMSNRCISNTIYATVIMAQNTQFNSQKIN